MEEGGQKVQIPKASLLFGFDFSDFSSVFGSSEQSLYLRRGMPKRIFRVPVAQLVFLFPSINWPLSERQSFKPNSMARNSETSERATQLQISIWQARDLSLVGAKLNWPTYRKLCLSSSGANPLEQLKLKLNSNPQLQLIFWPLTKWLFGKSLVTKLRFCD